MNVQKWIAKMLARITGTVKVPVAQKQEKDRGNGERNQREVIKRWWN